MGLPAESCTQSTDPVTVGTRRGDGFPRQRFRFRPGPVTDEGRTVSATMRAHDVHVVPPEIVDSVFYSATVSDSLAILVAETVGTTQRIAGGNEGAVRLLGYAVGDLRTLPVEQLLPTLPGGELRLLLRRERTGRISLPVRTASGAEIEAVVVATPAPSGR